MHDHHHNLYLKRNSTKLSYLGALYRRVSSALQRLISLESNSTYSFCAEPEYDGVEPNIFQNERDLKKSYAADSLFSEIKPHNARVLGL